MSLFCHTREGGYPELLENTGFPSPREWQPKTIQVVYGQTLNINRFSFPVCLTSPRFSATMMKTSDAVHIM